MAAADARARIAAQASLEAKLAVADHVIDNDGELEALDAAVGEVWRDLTEMAGRTMRP